MTTQEIINAILLKNQDYGIELFAPASLHDIKGFERKIGFQLPQDFKDFYLICNGFGCVEDIFNFVQLEEVTRYSDNYGPTWFYFAEYMMYADTWGMRLTPSGSYEIFNGHYPEVALTSSLTEFLLSFLKGNVFEESGLYDWQSSLGIK